MSALSRLGHLEIFSTLSVEALRALANVTTTRTYDDGQIVLLEGDPSSPIFFVLEGIVRVFRTNLDGREQTLIYLEKGAAFNIPAAFADDLGAPASAVAIGPVELLLVTRSDFRRIVSHTPELALAVLRDFSNKLYHLTRLTYDLSLRTVRGRLARFLLDHAQEGNVAPVRWTHEEIAARIGTVREVVSRTLRAFVQDGLIKIDRQRIVVLNPEALALEAES